MSQTPHISSHMLTPRWTHAIDVRALSRREDLQSLAAIGLSLLAVLRDHAVPRPAAPLADLPRRAPRRPESTSEPTPTPRHLPQETEDRLERETSAATIL